MEKQIKNITFSDLYTENYRYTALMTMFQTWKNGVLFERRTGRPTSAVIWLNKCTGEYTVKNGTTVVAERGSVVCLPQGSKYSVLNVECDGGKDDAIMCEFSVSDDGGIKTFGEVPFVLYKNCPTRLCELFRRSAELCISPIPSPLTIEIAAKQILEFIAEEHASRKIMPPYIEKGISILYNDIVGEYSIEEIAAKCFVSSRLFRKKFREYVGKSPVEFREDIRVELLKNILSADSYTTQQAVELLGFNDVSYFYKFFKKKTGVTPSEYRNKH